MKKNPLSLWTFSYNKSYYLIHPWRWIRDIYWNIKNFWHRGKYGYAYVDVWNFCDWYPRVAAEALRYLALHNNGYPATRPWTTMEEWREYLNYLANRLQRCADSQDILFGEERNEYKEEFDKIMKKTRESIYTDDGSTIIPYEFTPEQEEIRKKYIKRAEEITEADQAYIVETFKWLAEDLRRIWD